MLDASKHVLELCENNRAQIFIIEGAPGAGKTAYGANIVAEVHSIDNEIGNWDTNIFKKYMGFHPQRVLERWVKAQNEKIFLWDDAGAWINALDFQHPLIKKIAKQLQTIRTKYHCVVFTCLDADDLAKKIRIHKDAITIRISLMGSDPKSKYISQKYRRTATAKHWEKDWYEKSFRIDDWEEPFCCYMPLDFFYWYEPIRRHYSDMLTKLALKEAKQTMEIYSTYKLAEI